MRAKRLDEACGQFERAAKAQPAFVDAQSNLGNVLRQLGRVAESVAPLKRAFAGNPMSAEVADLLGASLLETGDARGAAAVFEASAKARPQEARTWRHLATARQSSGDSKRALEAIGARLQAHGSGRLVFFRSPRPAMSAQIEQRMRQAFGKAGVDYDRTTAWIPTLDRGRFFGLMRRATAMLDTIGFSGFNTAVQALECELPVAAFEGATMRGRPASGPLRHLGLDDLVATTPTGFADIAMRLVEDAPWRAHLGREIAQRRHALFFDQAPVRALEAALFEAAGVARPG